MAPTGVSAVQSQAGSGRTPGNTTTPGYVGDAGRGGQGQTDPFSAPLDSTPGRPGMIILSL
ncbi:MAG: hypothetical protein CVU56_25995 [Deltaproteobacteria bacterium HGW-Deltaproteobacteria-14]|nr:MAG: hypothetical protein CVU56_25995 [Deltaproteobacteria bacterium HGW-Deltaproteobacteria-14]